MPNFTSHLDDDMSTVPTAADVFALEIPVPPRRTPVDAAALKDALVRKPDGTMAFRGFQLDSIGLSIEPGMDEHDWEDLGYILKTFDERRQWWIGDWLAHGERTWSKTYSWAAEQFGYEVQSLRDITYVCKSVKVSVRTDTLSFAHHKLVASCPPELQAEWLHYAATNGLNVATMRQYMRVLVQFEPQVQRDWLQWMAGQAEMSPEVLHDEVRKALERDNPTISQKPPTLFAQEHVDLLRDMQKLVKNERKLAKTNSIALRAYANELGEVVQRLLDLADEKERRR